MSVPVEVEIVIPESMGRVEALAKVAAVLNRVVEGRLRQWRASRGEIAVFRLHRGQLPASRTGRWRTASPATGAAIRRATSGT